MWYLPIVMANVYFLGEKNGPWVLVDAGVRGGAWRIKQAAMETFGQAPECIVLTHGHFDHVGGLPQLAQEWNVPVYAHALETPFLNGSADYPPPDPRWADSWRRCHACSRTAVSTSEFICGHFPPTESFPDLEEWRWIHTPGPHFRSRVAFREDDRSLIAGDAVITINQENAAKLMTQAPRVPESASVSDAGLGSCPREAFRNSRSSAAYGGDRSWSSGCRRVGGGRITAVCRLTSLRRIMAGM